MKRYFLIVALVFDTIIQHYDQISLQRILNIVSHVSKPHMMIISKQAQKNVTTCLIAQRHVYKILREDIWLSYLSLSDQQ